MKQFSDLTPSAERIVDAAEVLIQSVGYNGFSYEDVAQIVGIRKPSVHHHFATKMELGAVVVQRHTHRFRQLLLDIEGRTSRAPVRLEAYAHLFEATYEHQRRLCLCGMLGAEADSLPDEVRMEVRQFFGVNLEWLTRVFAQGLEQGTLRGPGRPDALAEVFLSLLEGAMMVGRGIPVAHGPRSAAGVFLAMLTSTAHP